MSGLHLHRAEPGTDRTPRHPLEEREYRGSDGELHHHTNVWMNRHGEEEGGHRGGTHDGRGEAEDRLSGTLTVALVLLSVVAVGRALLRASRRG